VAMMSHQPRNIIRCWRFKIVNYITWGFVIQSTNSQH